MADTKNHREKSEPHNQNHSHKLNWLRAAVLGANDGTVSIAALVIGVAEATHSPSAILIAGIAGIVAGAVSMGMGEFVSVSTQRDTEKALIEKEKRELVEHPELELAELAEIYMHKGLSQETARVVAEELTANDPIKAHLEAELGIDEETLTNPWHAAYASSLAFLCGAIIPLLIIIFSPDKIRVPITFGAVVVALTINGALSAYVGGSSKRKAVIRVVSGGVIAMAVTFTIGRIFGVAGL